MSYVVIRRAKDCDPLLSLEPVEGVWLNVPDHPSGTPLQLISLGPMTAYATELFETRESDGAQAQIFEVRGNGR